MNTTDFQEFLKTICLINTYRNGICLPICKGSFNRSFDKVEIRDVSSYGRGVFATEDIDENMVVTLYPQHGGCSKAKNKAYVYGGIEQPSEEEFWDYAFTIEDGTSIYGSPDIIHHGWLGHMINDGTPNAADIKLHTKEQIGQGTITYMIKFPMYSNCRLDNKNGLGYVTTTKKIKRGEELFVSYGYSYWSSHTSDIQEEMLEKHLKTLNNKQKNIILNLMHRQN